MIPAKREAQLQVSIQGSILIGVCLAIIFVEVFLSQFANEDQMTLLVIFAQIPGGIIGSVAANIWWVWKK